MERRKVWKIFLVWEMEKEEEWLNEMAMNGWLLDSVGFCNYTFVRCEPDTYTIRFEMRGTDPAYISLMEQSGAEYVGHVLRWVYWRRSNEYGPFDIFSDIDSRIDNLTRVGRMLAVIGAMNILIGLMNSVNRVGIGWINLLCGCLLMYALGRIHGKIEALNRERLLHE